MNFQAKFLDASQPEVVFGKVVIDSTGLVFTLNDSTSRRYTWQQIKKLKRIGVELYLDCPTESNFLSKQLILFDVSDTNETELLKLWKRHQTFLKRIGPQRLSLLSFAVLFALLLIFLSWSWIQFTHNIGPYLPKSIDKALGDQVVEQQLKAQPKWENPKIKSFAEHCIRLFNEGENLGTVWLVDDPMPNAFALPNGDIAITKSLLTKIDGPDALAAILAHEVGHVVKRHSVRQLCQNLGLIALVQLYLGMGLGDVAILGSAAEFGSTFMSLKYSRDFEHEADEFALQQMQKHHISSSGIQNFFNEMGQAESSELMNYLSTHPVPKERVIFFDGLNQNNTHIDVDWWPTPEQWKSWQ